MSSSFNSVNRQSRVPTNRISRMFRLGKMATGIAGGVLNEGVKRLSRGELPERKDLLLTSANATRLANHLAEMRGAVMKIGQLLSMEAGDIIPRELTDILAQLREGAHSMPVQQLDQVLSKAWGEQWRDMFQSFNEQPFAAASIGQVHEAVDNVGRRLAIKVQYPGIKESINSDVDNAISLLRMLRLIPEGIDISPLMETAKQQLHDEADYLLEARYLELYRSRLEGHQSFELPQVINALTHETVLVMTFVEGDSIERLAEAKADIKNELASQIIELSLKEFLHWGMVQTDPNFANFRFNPDGERLGLLDFGALRLNERHRTQAFRTLLKAALDGDLERLVEAACEVGYIAKDDPFNYRLAIADLIQTAAEPAMQPGQYDFAHSTLSQRMSDKLYKLRTQKEFQRIPPADVIFLHRKLAGIYLLLAKIKASVDVRSKIEQIFSLQPEAA